MNVNGSVTVTKVAQVGMALAINQAKKDVNSLCENCGELCQMSIGYPADIRMGTPRSFGGTFHLNT